MWAGRHGRDYKGALGDFVKVGGAVAMPPRHAMGVWFTRWYDFTQVSSPSPATFHTVCSHCCEATGSFVPSLSFTSNHLAR